jgi:hypothetical protein
MKGFPEGLIKATEAIPRRSQANLIILRRIIEKLFRRKSRAPEKSPIVRHYQFRHSELNELRVTQELAAF